MRHGESLWLEQLALGELAAPRERALRQALGAGVAPALTAIAASNREILAGFPPHEMCRGMEARARWSKPGLLGLGLGALLATAGIAVGIVAFPGEPAPDARPEVLWKGDDLSLRVYRWRDDHPEALRSGEPAAPRDLVQVAYRAPAGTHGVIVSLDGRGEVTLHLPEVPGPAPALEPGREVPLAHAFELDDAPGFERFFLVVSERSFDSSLVTRAAEQAWASRKEVLDLDPGMRLVSFELRKEPTP